MKFFKATAWRHFGEDKLGKPVKATAWRHYGVLVRGHLVKACIEIKFSKAPVVTKGFYQSVTDLRSKNNFILCPADIDDVTREGIRIVEIITFIKKYLPGL